MSTGQAASPMTVEEEITRYLSSVNNTASLREVVRWVKYAQPDLAQEAIEGVVNDLVEQGKLKTTTFFELV